DRFRGVATEATIISIIVTKDGLPPFGNNPGRTGQFNPALLPSAFAFATDKIEELGLPSVTLLNIGSIGDPTDGSVSFCNLVDDYVAAGNPFVCGVGDDGGQDNSSVKMLTEGEVTDFVFEKGQDGFLRFTAWYAEDARVQLSIIRPDGTIEGPFAPPTGPSSARDQNLDGISIFHRGRDVEFSGSSAELRQLLIDFSGMTGAYTVRLSTTSIGTDNSIIGMLNPATFSSTNRFTNTTMPGGNLASFSACFGTITPGDYVATNNYIDVNGVPRARTGEGLPGEIWLGSSVGPTMDGRDGVDFVAPGEISFGAYSDDSFYSSFTFAQVEGGDGKYGIQTAVSAAAPLVTGLIALMLEVKPDLTSEQIRTILQETARTDNFTGTTPNTVWGHGKLDAKAALDRVFDLVSVPSLSFAEVGITMSPNPVSEAFSLTSANSQADLFDLTIRDLHGRIVQRKQASLGKPISVAKLARGVYLVSLRTVGGVATGRLVKQQ
ncbi:MAG: S8 family peptidase, partial [Bacteroidota bacterium]